MQTTRLCIALLDAHKKRVRVEVTRDFHWHSTARPIQNSMQAATTPKYFNANSVVVATLLTQQHEQRTMHITGHTLHQLISFSKPSIAFTMLAQFACSPLNLGNNGFTILHFLQHNSQIHHDMQEGTTTQMACSAVLADDQEIAASTSFSTAICLLKGFGAAMALLIKQTFSLFFLSESSPTELIFWRLLPHTDIKDTKQT
jgi:hypothetical protein